MSEEKPDFYMFDYEPYRDGNNPNHTPGSIHQTLSYLKQGYLDQPYNKNRKQAFYSNVKTWLSKVVNSLQGPLVIAIAPGHEANPNPSGFMHDVIGEFLASNPVADGRKQLIRTKTVPKQSQTPGFRNEDTHRGTIAINPAKEVHNKDKTVLILDDVWTSGSTLRVCKEVMLTTTNPKDVKLLAIGKTVSSITSYFL